MGGGGGGKAMEMISVLDCSPLLGDRITFGAHTSIWYYRSLYGGDTRCGISRRSIYLARIHIGYHTRIACWSVHDVVMRHI